MSADERKRLLASIFDSVTATAEGVDRLETCADWKPHVVAAIPKPVKMPNDPTGVTRAEDGGQARGSDNSSARSRPARMAPAGGLNHGGYLPSQRLRAPLGDAMKSGPCWPRVNVRRLRDSHCQSKSVPVYRTAFFSMPFPRTMRIPSRVMRRGGAAWIRLAASDQTRSQGSRTD
jgi:hypothetical protein